MNVLSRYNVSFNSELDTVRKVLLDISNFIFDSYPMLSVEQKGELKLIFSELLCNAVVHGNKCDYNKIVNVTVEIRKSGIISTVRDEGEGFDYLKLLEDVSSSNNLFKESGRGILLVYKLSDSLSFNIKGNEIRFHKKVSA